MPSPADTETVFYRSQSSRARPAATPEFPGCRSFRLRRDEIESYERHIEYWDAATETAMVAREPTTVYHEGPGQQLSALLTRIAAVRGAPILTLGTADLSAPAAPLQLETQEDG